MKKLLIIFLLFIITQLTCSADYVPAKLIKVYDGDTIKVLINDTEKCIRLTCIDCYETSKINRAYKQAYENNITIEEVVKRGKKSKYILESLLNDNPSITVDIRGEDKYGRSLGVVYANGINVNKYMVKYGGCLKFHYKK